MKKSDILALLESCRVRVNNALSRNDLSQEQKEQLVKIGTMVTYQIVYVDKHVPETDTEKLKDYYEKFSSLEKNIKALEVPTAVITKPKKEKEKKEKKEKKVKVTKVIKEKDQKKATKAKRGKLKKVLVTLGVATVVVIIVLSVSKCSSNPKKEEEIEKPGIEEFIEEEKTEEIEENIITIDELDLDDYEALTAFAEEIKASLGETDYSIDDIINAIRLANFEKLENKAIFETRESVLDSSETIGSITTTLGSDSIIRKDENDDIYVTEDVLNNMLTNVTGGKLTTTAFADAKKNDKYDIYAIADVCIKGMNAKDENSFLYGKAFNELMARHARSMTVTPNAPISTRYSLAGMYNVNEKTISSLTAGRNWGPIYGDGTEIDGSYGFICVEELAEYLAFYNNGKINENNMLYTFVIDQNITAEFDKGLGSR